MQRNDTAWKFARRERLLATNLQHADGIIHQY